MTTGTNDLGFIIALLIALVFWGMVFCCVVKADDGIASFYGAGEPLNIHTANGEVFNPKEFTCATYQYQFNTLLRVSYKDKSVIVRVNDRGPNKRLGRLIDLTPVAFKQLAPLKKGLIEVNIESYHKARVK